VKIENFIKHSPSTLQVLSGLTIQQKAKQELQALGLNLNFLQALVLAAVFFEQPEPVMVTKIVTSTGLSKSNVSQIISHLESEGFLNRNVHEEDQRIWLLTTTKKAASTVPKIVTYFDSVQQNIEDQFSEENLKNFYEISQSSKNFES